MSSEQRIEVTRHTIAEIFKTIAEAAAGKKVEAAAGKKAEAAAGKKVEGAAGKKVEAAAGNKVEAINRTLDALRRLPTPGELCKVGIDSVDKSALGLAKRLIKHTLGDGQSGSACAGSPDEEKWSKIEDVARAAAANFGTDARCSEQYRLAEMAGQLYFLTRAQERRPEKEEEKYTVGIKTLHRLVVKTIAKPHLEWTTRTTLAGVDANLTRILRENAGNTAKILAAVKDARVATSIALAALEAGDRWTSESAPGALVRAPSRGGAKQTCPYYDIRRIACAVEGIISTHPTAPEVRFVGYMRAGLLMADALERLGTSEAPEDLQTAIGNFRGQAGRSRLQWLRHIKEICESRSPEAAISAVTAAELQADPAAVLRRLRPAGKRAPVPPFTISDQLAAILVGGDDSGIRAFSVSERVSKRRGRDLGSNAREILEGLLTSRLASIPPSDARPWAEREMQRARAWVAAAKLATPLKLERLDVPEDKHEFRIALAIALADAGGSKSLPGRGQLAAAVAHHCPAPVWNTPSRGKCMDPVLRARRLDVGGHGPEASVGL